MTLQSARVVVVGGTAGIGLEVARMAAARGARVHVGGRLKADPSDLLSSISDGATAASLDIMDEASIERFFREVGGCDHLVTTASVMKPGPFRDGPIADARLSIEGKLWAQYLCARYADARVSITFFSGMISDRPRAGQVIVGVANAAVEGLGRGLAVELAPVRVNVISPGLVKGTAAYSTMPEADREAMYDGAARALPAGLVAGPASIAAMTIAVMENEYATGAVFHIDGGALIV